MEFSLSTLVVGSAIASDATRRAVELYDSRVEAAPSDFLSTTGSIVWTEADSDCSFEVIGYPAHNPITWLGSWNATLAAETARDSSMIAGSIPGFLHSCPRSSRSGGGFFCNPHPVFFRLAYKGRSHSMIGKPAPFSE